MPYNNNCLCDDATKCIDCLTTMVKNIIFDDIQYKQDGEVDEEWYENELDRVRHALTDETICRVCEHEEGVRNKIASYLIGKYGIHNALEAYETEYGQIPALNNEVDICLTLLYNIIDKNMPLSFEDFKEYCKYSPME